MELSPEVQESGAQGHGWEPDIFSGCLQLSPALGLVLKAPCGFWGYWRITISSPHGTVNMFPTKTSWGLKSFSKSQTLGHLRWVFAGILFLRMTKNMYTDTCFDKRRRNTDTALEVGQEWPRCLRSRMLADVGLTSQAIEGLFGGLHSQWSCDSLSPTLPGKLFLCKNTAAWEKKIITVT